MSNINAAAGAKRHSGFRPHAMTTVSALAMLTASFAAGQSAQAQTAAPASAPASLDEIVVTGSRVVRDGYEAPTPVTVLGVEQIQQSGYPDLFSVVRTMPAFGTSGDGTRAGGNSVSSGRQGQNTFNLRSLGETRTLSLLNGHRIGSSDLNGAVDTNVFPQTLVSRVDVVTGGASAAYGSDALAGVVNFVLDTEFTGVKGEVSSGITTFGDDWTGKANLAVGTPFASGRGHVIASYAWDYDPGVFPMSARAWNKVAWKIIPNSAYGTGPGQSTSVPEFLLRSHTGLINASPGGIITAGPLKGTAFNKEGAPFQFIYPDVQGGGFIAGGMAPLNDTSQFSQNVTTRSRQENLFGRVSYDLADNVTVYTQFISHYSKTYGLSKLDDSQGNLTIRADNPYIPADTLARMTALGLTSFTMGSFNLDIPNLSSHFKRRTWVYSVGANGTADVGGSSWNWDVFAQYTLAKNNLRVATRNNVLFPLSVDAVRNANGATVCRVNADTNPANDDPRCLPYNPFGWGKNDKAVIDYFKGFTHRLQDNTEKLAEFSASGEPFELWAGPVSIAFGGGWREEKVVDPNFGPNAYDPVSLTRPFSAGNYLPTNGKYSVTEGYIETVVPLAKDTAWARSLDVNAAARATDYSTAGYVTTWKIGVTYNPIDDIRLRATLSRDIRAPNLGEIFATGTGGQAGGIRDPFNGGQTAGLFLTETVGNPNLVPEKADTLGLGVVLQPTFLPGFSAAVDYYSIDIKGAIQQVNAQTTLDLCFIGQTALCSNIQRQAPTPANPAGVITLVTSRPTNYAFNLTRGIDFEATYNINLDEWVDTWNGSMVLRALASHAIESTSDDGLNPPQDAAGNNTGGLPYWKFFLNATYMLDPITVGVTGRGVSSGNYGPTYYAKSCTSGCPVSTTFQRTLDSNYIAGQWQFDANITYRFMHKNDVGADADAFLTISNVFNTEPPVVATSSPEYWHRTNSLLYDVLGRAFRAGLRFKY
ncbi:MAG: TonB-dependent receptor [Rhodospirillaceae bacterium]|nr:TonB-dependent receptor [Rhodospirillaceae bacterium]